MVHALTPTSCYDVHCMKHGCWVKRCVDVGCARCSLREHLTGAMRIANMSLPVSAPCALLDTQLHATQNNMNQCMMVMIMHVMNVDDNNIQAQAG